MPACPNDKDPVLWGKATFIFAKQHEGCYVPTNVIVEEVAKIYRTLERQQQQKVA